jgi:DNA-binding Lrp family transcriptional regulator
MAAHMQDFFTTTSSTPDSDITLDETDLALVNALQLDPRAAWSTVGQALGIDPVTAARRWQRLTSAGAAWVTAYPVGSGCGAFIEVDCAAGRVEETGRALASWPHVLTVEFTSGSRDLLLLVATSSLAALARYVLRAINALDGVTATRTHLITYSYAEGGGWQIRALDAEQRAGLGTRRRTTRPAGRPHTGGEQRLVTMLARDGRLPLTDLAAGLECSVSTARRRLNAMISANLVIFRCDIAQPLSGWPVSLSLWSRVPPALTERAVRQVAALPEVRACMGLTGGTSNLLFSSWLRSLEDAMHLEERLVAQVPELVVVDRAISLGFAKRTGQLLDGDGRRTGCVPIEPWIDPNYAAFASTANSSDQNG